MGAGLCWTPLPGGPDAPVLGRQEPWGAPAGALVVTISSIFGRTRRVTALTVSHFKERRVRLISVILGAAKSSGRVSKGRGGAVGDRWEWSFRAAG